MSDYESLVYWANRGLSTMLIAMLAILYYALGTITNAELSAIMTQVSMTYNTTTNVLTNGSTMYSVNDLLNYIISAKLYANNIAISQPYMASLIGAAKDYSLITSDQATALEALLK